MCKREYILVALMLISTWVNAQVKSDISTHVDETAVTDSSHLYQEYQDAKDLSERTQMFYEGLSNENLTEEELRNKVKGFLQNNDSLITKVKTKLYSDKEETPYDSLMFSKEEGIENARQKMDDSLSNYSNLDQESVSKYLGEERGDKVNEHRESSDQLMGDIHTMEKWSQGDSLSSLQDSPEFRESLNKHGVDVEKIEDKKENYQQLRYMQSDELLSSANIKVWPLEQEYDSSLVSGYYEQYADSVEQKKGAFVRQLQPPVISTEVLENLATEQLDSIREASIEDAKIKIKKTEVGQKVDRLNLKEKQSLFTKPDYSELIVGFDQTNSDRLTLTPSIAYELSKYLFVGVGLEVAMDFKDFQNSILGYKGVMRYNPEESIFYLQAESISYFSKISYFSSENGSVKASYEQALNMGIGAEYALGRHMSINSAVLYKLIRSENSRDDSPIIFRLGFTFK